MRLILRLLRIVLWPVRIPIILVRRLFRVGRRAGGAAESSLSEAALAGGASRVASKSEEKSDVRSDRVFRSFEAEPSDELRLASMSREEQIRIAETLAERAQTYFRMRTPLFLKPGTKTDEVAYKALNRDFYEEVEMGLVRQVTSIDNDGRVDQFVRETDRARRLTNENACILYCELAPMLLFVLLVAQALLLSMDPLHILQTRVNAGALETYLRQSSGALVVTASIFAAGFLAIAFIHYLLFLNCQRINGQKLNNFIQNEFSRLNDAFRVAHTECLRAEAEAGNTREDYERVAQHASWWALARHWISVRQVMEETALRNAMFQVHRNMSFYRMSGIVISGCIALLLVGLTLFFRRPAIANGTSTDLAALGAMLAAGYILSAFGLIMRGSYSAFASQLAPDEWHRFDSLAVGNAIQEQVTNDKKQILTHRDRVR